MTPWNVYRRPTETEIRHGWYPYRLILVGTANTLGCARMIAAQLDIECVFRRGIDEEM